jgi:hypothetical protein
VTAVCENVDVISPTVGDTRVGNSSHGWVRSYVGLD